MLVLRLSTNLWATQIERCRTIQSHVETMAPKTRYCIESYKRVSHDNSNPYTFQYNEQVSNHYRAHSRQHVVYLPGHQKLWTAIFHPSLSPHRLHPLHEPNRQPKPGFAGSSILYCWISPWSQLEKYKNLSSSEMRKSVMSPGISSKIQFCTFSAGTVRATWSCEHVAWFSYWRTRIPTQLWI